MADGVDDVQVEDVVTTGLFSPRTIVGDWKATPQVIYWAEAGRVKYSLYGLHLKWVQDRNYICEHKKLLAAVRMEQA